MFSIFYIETGRGAAGKPGSVVGPPSVWGGAFPSRLPAVHPQASGPEPARLLLDFAPEEVFRAPPVAGRAVGSYPAFSPLTVGGMFSVALSVVPHRLDGAERPGVTRLHALRSPDFPPGMRPLPGAVPRRRP